MVEYKEKQKITDLIDITQNQLDEIKTNMEIGEYMTIYNDKNIKISLFKERKNKINEIVLWYGDKPFTEVFKEMVKISHSK